MEYIILQKVSGISNNNDLLEFQEEINEKLIQGWVPSGPLSVSVSNTSIAARAYEGYPGVEFGIDYIIYTQALVRG